MINKKLTLFFSVTFFVLCSCNSVNPIPKPDYGNLKYKIHRTNVSGSSTGFRVLGLIPILFSEREEAIENLYTKNNIESGSPKFLLINAVEERKAFYFFLGSINKITVHGDIVEVID